MKVDYATRKNYLAQILIAGEGKGNPIIQTKDRIYIIYKKDLTIKSEAKNEGRNFKPKKYESVKELKHRVKDLLRMDIEAIYFQADDKFTDIIFNDGVDILPIQTKKKINTTPLSEVQERFSVSSALSGVIKSKDSQLKTYMKYRTEILKQKKQLDKDLLAVEAKIQQLKNVDTLLSDLETRYKI